jgi:tRNA 2-thiouridine synthesizing protein D
MKFAIMLNESPLNSKAGHIASQFIIKALNQGHSVLRVFLYGDAIYHAYPDSLQAPESAWFQLPKDFSTPVDVVFCLSAAERRGFSIPEDLSHPISGFRPGGLGLWMEALQAADQTLQL